jgi:hypothetical protein
LLYRDLIIVAGLLAGEMNAAGGGPFLAVSVLIWTGILTNREYVEYSGSLHGQRYQCLGLARVLA